MRSLALAALLILVATQLFAEPPTARYVAGQLQVAESALQQAEAALASGDYDKARRLAAQATLDARLAWGMTDAAAPRRAATQIAQRAERLRLKGLLAARLR